LAKNGKIKTITSRKTIMTKIEITIRRRVNPRAVVDADAVAEFRILIGVIKKNSRRDYDRPGATRRIELN
jgi:hypothetical protein